MFSPTVRRRLPSWQWAINLQSIAFSLLILCLCWPLWPPAVVSAQTAPAVLPPTFSIPRGFYNTSFQVTLSTGTTGATIRYTTNGATPSTSVGTVYAGPITIATTTPLRAIAYKGSDKSLVVTHTYLFLNNVVRQNNTPPGYPTTFAANDADGPYPADYEMDPEVVNDPAYANLAAGGMKAIPSVSIVTDIANLFDPATGIYYNANQKGSAWERPISIEWINGDGSTGFAENGGLRTHGQASRRPWRTPKKSLRVYFKAAYGVPKLDYALFTEATAVQKFDRFLLKGGSNRSWPYYDDGQRKDADYVNDEFPRIAFREMGHLAPNGGTYVHLYLNGIYWGLYDITERIDEKYMVAYLGGAETDYDLIVPDEDADPAYTPTPIVGTIDAWNQLLASVESTPVSAATYNQVLTKLDVVDLVDYILVTHYVGNTDWPAHNWYTYRKRSGPDTRFRFLPWDNDTGFRTPDRNITQADYEGTPARLFLRLITNPDFKQLVSDRLTLHATGNGVLTAARCSARYGALANIIDQAIIGESARWGDHRRDLAPNYKATVLYGRNNFWAPVVQDRLTVYCPQRTTNFVNQYLANGWYLPNTKQPTFSQNGGAIALGGSFTINNPNTSAAGDIYYTTNGTDPRALGGGITPGAIAAGDSVVVAINGVTTVQARVKNGSAWSAPQVATFYPPQDFSALVVNELHYNPLTAVGVDGDLYEFIELYNKGATALRLDNVSFSRGITYKFPLGTTLAPGGYVVLASDYAQFQATYSFAPFAGYVGNLSNSGEGIELKDALGTVIDLVDYKDLAPWPLAADGTGPSLELTNPTLDNNLATNWKASTVTRGTPGARNSTFLAGNPPTVALTSPANGSTSLTGAAVVIAATANDSDGTVTQVAFFANGVAIAGCIDPTAPYECTWTPTVAGNYALTAQATDNQTVTGGSAAVNVTVNDLPNQLPTVSISSPTNGATAFTGSPVTVAANAADVDGTVTQVAFFANGAAIAGCVDTTAPYQCTWTPTAAGNYALTAQATDNKGGVTLSGAVNVTVSDPANQLPTVSISSPANGANFTLGSAVTVVATASDVNGTVTQVVFLVNGAPIPGCVDTTSPYQCTWTPTTLGSYALTAQATDNQGGVGGSTAVNITVSAASNQLPNVSITSPANGATGITNQAVAIAATASDADGTVAQVAFFANGAAIAGCVDTTAPYTCTWTPTAPGVYSLTAQATDNQSAQKLSTAISITIANLPDGTGAFREQNGLVVMEAEHYHANVARSSHAWEARTEQAGFVAESAMASLPNNRMSLSSISASPEMQYKVQFAKTGTYQVWLRTWAATASDDSAYLGIDGQMKATIAPKPGGWLWTRKSFAVSTVGLHTISVWMREDGLYIDRILMTTDSKFTPSGAGPAESPRVATANEVAAVAEAPAGSIAPTLSLFGVDEGEVLMADATINLVAEATNDPIESVAVLINGVALEGCATFDTLSECAWTPSIGSYTLTAVMQGVDQQSLTAIVTVTVAVEVNDGGNEEELTERIYIPLILTTP